jgi:hypothetical protein
VVPPSEVEEPAATVVVADPEPPPAMRATATAITATTARPAARGSHVGIRPEPPGRLAWSGLGGGGVSGGPRLSGGLLSALNRRQWALPPLAGGV